MFHGSIPDTVRQILGSIVKDWNVSDIYVGCSGNFTIERTLSGVTSAKLHGNDVTIYSCLLGDYFAGNKIAGNFNYRKDYSGAMEILTKGQSVQNYMKDDTGIVTVALLLSKMSLYLGSKPNDYYNKMIEAYKSQWDYLFDSTYKKMYAITPILTSFYKGDVCEWINGIPEDCAFVCYPPFFSGDYEKMFRVIEDIIEWSPPEYEMIDKDKILDMFRKMTKHKYFMFSTNDKIDEFSEYLVGISQTTNRGVPLYIYAKSNKTRIIMPNQKINNALIERLGENEDLGNEIKIIQLKSENFHALRSQYMNVNIKPGSESAAYGVLVDDKLIGVYAFSAAPTLANWDNYIDTPFMYLLSDFPVFPSKYKRLSKLVLYAALSKESKMLAERISNKRIKSLITTAFSKNPVSMKYRGLFKLLNKKKLTGTTTEQAQYNGERDISEIYYNEGYQLNYGALMGQWTLKESLELWKNKFLNVTGGDNDRD